jgi:membrane protease YdiL (CAAX protease family)
VLVWLVSPALAGILLRAFGGDGWQDAGFKLNLISGWKWYLVALLVYPLVALLAFWLGSVTGAVSATNEFATQGWSAFAAIVGVGIASSLMKNIFEEFAWRGYLTPRLEAAKVPTFLNHLIVGVIWWSWHLPYYYYFLDRSVLAPYLTVIDLNTFLLLALIVLFPTAILFGELRLVSKSVWPAFVLHNIINGVSLPLVAYGFIKLNGLVGVFLSPTNESLLASLLMGVVGLLLYKYRMNTQNQ